jgi:hypothetical protein
MCQYILDTDRVSLILYNHPQAIANTALHQIAVTVIRFKHQWGQLKLYLISRSNFIYKDFFFSFSSAFVAPDALLHVPK